MAKKKIERIDQIFGESELITSVFAEREQAPQRLIPIESLVPNRFNPRQSYPKETLDELIRSMKEHGFIGALDGRELPDGRVELAYGSRRLLAAKAAGINTIPVFLHDWDDNQLRFISLVENLIREDLTPHEQAETIGRMHEELGLSVREVTRRTGKPKSWVEDRLALYRAPQDVKTMVATRSDALRAANYIARIPDEASRRLLEEKAINEELTTRQIQQAVQQIVEEGMPAQRAITLVTTEVEAPPSRPSPPPMPAPEAPLPTAQPRPPAETPATAPPPTPPPVQPGERIERPSPEPVDQPAPSPPSVAPPAPPPPPIPPIPEEQEPYADVDTERLLAHLEQVVRETRRQLGLILQALLRRPLASWERGRTEAALIQLQKALPQLPVNREERSSSGGED